METRVKKNNTWLLFIPFLLMIVAFGVTVSFFNYTRAEETNILRLGDIEFSGNYTSITLQDVYPINHNDVGTDTDNVIETVVTIEGTTTYEHGVEYLITLVDVDNIVGNTAIPISLVADVSNGLGTSDDSYFTNRGSTDTVYKILTDDTVYNGEYVLVGYIPTSDSMTSGTITIKAYIDEDKVLICDTCYTDEESTEELMDGKVVVSSQDWNSAISEGISFSIKIEAYEKIWVDEPENFYDLIEEKATTAPTYVKSYTTSVINNGNSTFTTQDTVGTNNNKQEVYYYTGNDAITNGNVLFAGYCWQIVRTTDNGGIRLIYNGIAENNQCTSSRSNNTYLGVKSVYENVSLATAYLYGESYDYDLTTGKFHLVNPESGTRTWTLANYESFMGKYTCKDTTGTNCKNIWHVGEYLWNDDTKAESTKYSIGNINNYRETGLIVFNSGYSSPSNVGYMYNKIYNVKAGTTSGAIYGKDVEYVNGNYLVIENTSGVASSNVTIDSQHHYSCGTLDANDNPETTCEVVRYYYILYNNVYYYIELKGGETIEDALKNMLNYKQVGDNVDANINVYSSSVKDYLEIWYDKNLKAYEGYLDTNTVYCNDRTVIDLGGWNKDGGTYPSNWLKFKHYNYAESLNLACQNVTDRFSRGNIKARIRNPIGLITQPERELMGDVYVATNSTYLMLSPSTFSYGSANIRLVGTAGSTTSNNIFNNAGVRGIITLKPGTLILGGSGTDIDPYQVGPLI